jgi:catechol 2,3-dioxygenase-like lactoylglutathione lyase family enzyme
MKIKLTSVYVDDQDKALKFYTEVFACVASIRTSTCRSR